MEELLDLTNKLELSNKSDSELLSPSMEVELHVRRPSLSVPNKTDDMSKLSKLVPMDIKSSVSSTDIITTPDGNNFENIPKMPIQPQQLIQSQQSQQLIQPEQPTSNVQVSQPKPQITSNEHVSRKSKRNLKKLSSQMTSSPHLFELYGYQIPYETLIFVVVMILIAVALYFYSSPSPRKPDDEEN